MARILLLLAVVCFAVSHAEEVSIYERAKVWLEYHQEPQESELDVLKQQDPRTFSAVRQLLNRQALGTLNEHLVHAPAKLSQKVLEQFKLSKATEDRRSVLSLEAKMFAEKQKWAQMQDSKQTKLSKALTDDKPKPKPAPAKKAFRKPQAQKPAEESADGMASLDVLPAPRKRLSNLAESVSWGDLKKLAHAQKKGGQKYTAPVPWKTAPGWGTILKNMHTRQQEALTGKGSALAGFSWGDDQTSAESGEHKELSTLSETQVRTPAEVEMPDQLVDWMASGKKKSQEQQPQVEQEPTQQNAANPYSMDLN